MEPASPQEQSDAPSPDAMIDETEKVEEAVIAEVFEVAVETLDHSYGISQEEVIVIF